LPVVMNFPNAPLIQNDAGNNPTLARPQASP
jgi:hypothetical protein